jgi:microcompartment protein CcmK/EutM
VIDEGNSGRQLLGESKGAVKTIVVGVVDYVERDGRYTYDHAQESPR